MRQLRSADPTRRAEDLRRDVVVLPPAPDRSKARQELAAPAKNVLVVLEEDGSSDDDESELDSVEAELMEELLAARIRQASGKRLVSDVSELPRASIVVLHAYDPDGSDDVDDALEALAVERASARFCRNMFGEAVRDLVYESDRITPEKLRGSLCVFRESKLVALSDASAFFSGKGDQAVAVDALTQWLDRAGAFEDEPLRATAQLLPEEEEEAGQGEQFYDCGKPGCNRSFEHHHIGSTIPLDWDVHRRADLPSF